MLYLNTLDDLTTKHHFSHTSCPPSIKEPAEEKATDVQNVQMAAAKKQQSQATNVSYASAALDIFHVPAAMSAMIAISL